MTLGSALSIAQSGLTAASRAADITSQNVANALVDGYARREVSLATRDTGGVAVTGVERFVDQAVIADRRVAQAATAGSTAIANFHERMEAAIGTAGEGGAIGTLISDLEAGLIAAASQPQSTTALSGVVTAAETLADRFNEVGDRIQAARLKADGRIAATVSHINTALKQIEGMNTQIATHAAAGRDVAALQDRRQALVDGIAEQVPLREIFRDDGRIALMTTGGAALLDGKAAVLSVTSVRTMTAEMTVEGGALSGLEVNGRALSASALGDGELAAQFQIRDRLGVEAQDRLDATLADLTARLDGSGLIERAGGKAAVDPALAEEPWRLRDGLGAVTEGAAGDATRLNVLVTAMKGGGVAAADMLSETSSARLAAQDRASFEGARLDTLRAAELAGGVDTDAEMTNLLSIQQAYTANAKVIQAVDRMMQTIMGL